MTSRMTPELLGLVRQIEAAGSPLERLRLLALAWRTVRGLSSAERAELTARLGVEGASELVERLARRSGGLAPTALLEAVHAARDMDDADVVRVVRDLGDPQHREEAVRHGLEAVAEHLGEAAAAGDEAADPDPTDDDGLPPVPVAPPFSGDEKTSAELPPQEAAPHPEIPPPPSADARSETIPPAPPPSRPPSEAPVTAAARRPPRGERPAPAPRQAPAAARSSPWTRPSPTPSADPTSRVERLPLVDRMREARSVLVESGASLDGAGLGRLLDTLPEGWPRRRILAAALRLGLPPSLGEALRLVDGQPTAAARRWCLAALVEGRTLEGTRRDAVLELAGSVLERRRIEARMSPPDRPVVSRQPPASRRRPAPRPGRTASPTRS